jgi:aryl-phospho-beta-D-glucosidase BglC (GH1 family)
MEPIKIVYICDIEKKEILGNFPKGKDLKKYNDKIKSILNSGNYSENKLLNEEDEKYEIFNILKNKTILYIIISEKNIEEGIILSFIEELESSKIYVMIDEKSKKLNKIGEEQLKKNFEEFNKNPKSNISKLDSIGNELKETKNIMQNNIQNMIHNVDDMNNIEAKSAEIRSSSEIFKSKTKELSLKALWENKKWKIIFIGLILLLVFGLFFYLF